MRDLLPVYIYQAVNNNNNLNHSPDTGTLGYCLFIMSTIAIITGVFHINIMTDAILDGLKSYSSQTKYVMVFTYILALKRSFGDSIHNGLYVYT